MRTTLDFDSLELGRVANQHLDRASANDPLDSEAIPSVGYNDIQGWPRPLGAQRLGRNSRRHAAVPGVLVGRLGMEFEVGWSVGILRDYEIGVGADVSGFQAAGFPTGNVQKPQCLMTTATGNQELRDVGDFVFGRGRYHSGSAVRVYCKEPRNYNGQNWKDSSRQSLSKPHCAGRSALDGSLGTRVRSEGTRNAGWSSDDQIFLD